MTLVCGIDEAGRGPVIGPLVIAGVVVDEKGRQRLKALGVKDSKLLSVKQRNAMFSEIKKIVKSYKIFECSADMIDSVLFSQELNLNTFEAVKSAEIINSLKPDKAILDCPSNNIAAYKDFVKKHLKTKTSLVVEHKADLHYIEVAAASVLAKVTRDDKIEALKRKYEVDFGSGYPSDPKTVEFLKHNYDKFDFFRKSWATWKKVAIKKSQKDLGEF